MKERRDRDERKISEGVFDRSTLMSLYKLTTKGNLDQLDGIIATGKESNVYYGLLKNREIAIKIYCIETSDFKVMEKYVKGDRRFHGWRNRRQLIYTWAKKEFSNLNMIYGKAGGITRCPEPIAVHNNVLVMEFIGENTIAAPKLKNMPPENPKKYFNEIIKCIREIYSIGIVHGDLSEYNILNYNSPVFIDFSMGVLLDHPLADELLKRDIKNILNYFRKFGIEEDEGDVLNFVKSTS